MVVTIAGEIKHQAKDCNASCVITDSDSINEVLSAQLGLPIIYTGNSPLDGIHSFNQVYTVMKLALNLQSIPNGKTH